MSGDAIKTYADIEAKENYRYQYTQSTTRNINGMGEEKLERVGIIENQRTRLCC